MDIIIAAFFFRHGIHIGQKLGYHTTVSLVRTVVWSFVQRSDQSIVLFFHTLALQLFSVGDFHTYSPLNTPVPETDTI